MKWLLLSLIFVTCAAMNCRKKDAVYAKTGTLRGPDLALCACCGGVILEIQGISKTYRIDSLPGMSVQQFQNMTFPETIRFNYSDSGNCGGITRFLLTNYALGN